MKLQGQTWACRLEQTGSQARTRTGCFPHTHLPTHAPGGEWEPTPTSEACWGAGRSRSPSPPRVMVPTVTPWIPRSKDRPHTRFGHFSCPEPRFHPEPWGASEHLQRDRPGCRHPDLVRSGLDRRRKSSERETESSAWEGQRELHGKRGIGAGVSQDGRSSLALASKRGEEVSALVEGSSEVAQPKVAEAGRGRGGQTPGTRPRSWACFILAH